MGAPRGLPGRGLLLARLDGGDLLRAAMLSLSEGHGPAGGVPMNCTLSSGGGSCSSLALDGSGGQLAAAGSPGSRAVISGGASTLSPRFGAAIALFENGSSSFGTLLFGGVSSNGEVLNDTWQFLAGGWTMVSSSVTPSPRYGAAMAYDPNSSEERLLLAGGMTAGGVALDDYWFFSLPQGWILGASSSPWSPRANAAMTYDPTIGGMLMMGGQGGAQLVRPGVWEFTTYWNRVGTLPSGAARWGLGLEYDPTAGVAGYVLLFGGSFISGVSLAMVGQGDTWSISSRLLNPLLVPPGSSLIIWNDLTLDV